MHLNQRYTEAKQLYQAYTLQEVLDILHLEDDNSKADFSIMIDVQFMKHEIELLNRRIEKLKGYKCEKVQDTFPNEKDINFSMIEKYFSKT